MTEDDYAQPCVGCGYCCTTSVCIVGVIHLSLSPTDARLPCPALEFRDGRHWCGLIDKFEGEDKKLITELLSIGAGCCSSLNTWRNEIKDRRSK